MISPGAPATRRGIEREFWRKVAEGVSLKDAADMVGVSPAVGSRWSRQGGGMPTIELTEPGGRYLSFPSGRRSRSCGHRTSGCGRSRANSAALRRRSRVNCDAMSPPAAACWSIGRRSRSGRPS
uniref:Uncharacterized protein n=1 Tax=Rhodococcus sp. NS1 TaxID=402236 RepID=A0A097SQU1_9NOCA|nr:hypothetical protein LRS1606.455 [Rhodococcus sp. NS1]